MPDPQSEQLQPVHGSLIPGVSDAELAHVDEIVLDQRRRIGLRDIRSSQPVIPHSIEGYRLSVNTNRCRFSSDAICATAAVHGEEKD